MRKLFCLLLLVFSSFLWAGGSLEDADDAYMQGNYEHAAEIYENIAKNEANPQVFYNLGNTYYRLEDMGRAILNYERALLLEPNDQDTKFNLSLSKSRIKDSFNKSSEMFFITWLRDFIQSKSADQWGLLGIISFTLSLVSFGFYRFVNNISIRKIGFFLFLLGFMTAVFVNIAAAWNNYHYNNDSRAVIINNTLLYKSSNEEGEALRELNPGTIIEVIDENSRGWFEIVLTNGKTGWLKQSDASLIRKK